MNEALHGLELTVEKLVPGGDGFLRLPDGQVLFVRGAAPGDRIRLGEVEKQRGALYAAEYELLGPSPERVTPECPVAASCGGCDMMHVTRSAELTQKAGMLKDALERVGGVQRRWRNARLPFAGSLSRRPSRQARLLRPWHPPAGGSAGLPRGRSAHQPGADCNSPPRAAFSRCIGRLQRRRAARDGDGRHRPLRAA
jgi:hypothetical protein